MDKLKKFWAYKVLPLVYDSSLSYLEVLQKLVAKINEVITTTGEMAANVVEALKNSDAAVNTANEAENKAQEALNKANNIPTKTSDLINDSGFVNQTQAASAAPVQSVNGDTGNVSIEVPTKTSELINDSGFVNQTEAASAAPVQSVNGDTGNVSIEVPTKTSELDNDSGFITTDVPFDVSFNTNAFTTQVDALTVPGSYKFYVPYNNTDMPVTTHAWTGFIQFNDVNYINVIAYEVYNTGNVYKRTKYNGTWGSWIRQAPTTETPIKVLDISISAINTYTFTVPSGFKGYYLIIGSNDSHMGMGLINAIQNSAHFRVVLAANNVTVSKSGMVISFANGAVATTQLIIYQASI